MSALSVPLDVPEERASARSRLLAWRHVDIGLGITAGRIAGAYLAAMAVLNVGNAVAILRRPWEGNAWTTKGWLLFEQEGNPSTWFTSVALLAAAGAVLLVAASHEPGSRERRRWAQLALVPAVLSVDEVAVLHEQLGGIGRQVGDSGILNFAWVVPGAAILLLLAAVFGRFVLSQGAYVRNLLVAAAGLVVGGGVVMEAFNGWLDDEEAPASVYQLGSTVEENLEMLGIGLVIVGLVVLAGRRGLRLGLERPTAP